MQYSRLPGLYRNIIVLYDVGLYAVEQGLMSSVPLGMNMIPIKRALTTTSTAILCLLLRRSYLWEENPYIMA